MTQPTSKDRTTETTGTIERVWSTDNLTIIAVFTLLTLVGVVLSTGALNLGIVTFSSDPLATDSVRVPGFVYLYASMGALGYIFTKLMVGFESYDERSELEQLVELALRLPVAWVLGAGTFLLSAALLPGAGGSTPPPGSDGSTPAVSAPGTLRFAAGFAFLVGLYVNVTMKSLGSLADRLLGRTGGRETARPGGAGDTSDGDSGRTDAGGGRPP